jgi:uncharacterized protein (TIGR02145 family)
MKTLKLLSLTIVAVLFAACKASQPTGPPSGGTSSASLADVHNTLDSTGIMFAQFNNAAGATPQQAIIQTENWLKTQPGVQSVSDVDSTYLYITLSSGLTTTFSFDHMGPDGLSLTRGGPSNKSGGRFTVLGDPSAHIITNPNVLIYAAASSEFYFPGEMQKVLDLFTKSGLGLNVTLLTDQQCTYQMIDNLSNYGLVILDTHGSPDAFRTGSNVILPSGKNTDSAVKATIDGQLGSGTSNRILSGDLRISHVASIAWNGKYNAPKADTERIWVTSRHVSSLTNLSNTLIFGNMCYSGTTVIPILTLVTPIATAFNSLNPISYFCYGYDNGYSTGVLDDFAKQMEDSLVQRLVINFDSTGTAYRKSDTTRFYDPQTRSRNSGNFYFKQYGSDNYSYMPCIDSFTDVRDGQLYHTICIGNQIWMQENLNYNAPGSFYYKHSPALGAIYGRIYPWTVAMNGAASSNASPSGVKGVCPYGWHIPSAVEWQTLRTATYSANAIILNSTDPSIGGWPNDTSATNSSGFSALAGGYFNYGSRLTTGPDSGFEQMGNTALFHASTIAPSGLPVCIWVSSDWPIAKGDVQPSSDPSDPYQPSSNAYCRCVKDP